MSSIRVLAPGLQTTVQDLGRPGHGAFGISPCGAADRLALRAGNRLVGNPESAPALEMTLLGGAFQFGSAGLIALAGSDFSPTLDERPIELWISHEVRPGQVLRFAASRGGARSYLCVRGGIGVPAVLGSASTHLPSGLGGLGGRALREGDELPVGKSRGALKPLKLSASAIEFLSPRKRLRVTAGPHLDRFSEQARRMFLESPWQVNHNSNRLGLRLEGPAIPAAGETISSGVCLGAVQVPSSGQPIILFVDQQTTGGYPQIACVISADHSSVGQLCPMDEIGFELVETGEAVRLLRETERRFASLRIE